MKYLLMAFTLYSFSASAGMTGMSSVVSRHLKNKLLMAQNTFSESQSHPPILHAQNQDAYYLKRIRLQYAPFVAFDISIFAVKIMPIFEFRWTRKNPRGWVNYQHKI